MELSELVKNLKLETDYHERWAVLGPEADKFKPKLDPAQTVDSLEPDLDGILLVGLLSASPNAMTTLEKVVASVKEGASLAVIDWQYDGPLDRGPDLEQRFKQGNLCRLLRESGFGLVETVTNHPRYYLIQAVKGPPPSIPHAGEFVAVATLDELPKNAMKTVEVFGRQLIVANTGKEIVAIDRACPHARSPLDQGILRGRNLVCRQHAYIWNVRTGEPVEPPDEDLLHLYPVKVDTDCGKIFVALAPHLPKK